MRWFIIVVIASFGLGASDSAAQVGPGATMGGMANPSVGAGNMSMGANTARAGTNGGNVAQPSGVGGGYGSTTDASGDGAATNYAGAYPRPGSPRYFGQNNNT